MNDQVLSLEQNHRSCRLRAPASRALEHLRRTYPLYDRFYPRLARLVDEAAPGATIVDVGANIGDSAALCRLEGVRLPIFAVEPSEVFFPYLAGNVAEQPDLYGDTYPIRAFVGRVADDLSLAHAGGSARSVRFARAEGTTPVLALDAFEGLRPALVKVDTDGYDADILHDNAAVLARAEAIVWAEGELDPRRDDALPLWRNVLATLAPSHPFVCAFDNFGFPFCSGPTRELGATLGHVLAYCWRHSRHPPATHGHGTIYYLDIALFPERFADTFRRFQALLP